MSADVAAYAAQVRAALADLPPAVLEELLEDLDDHLAEVAAEGAAAGRSPADVLGPPALYAAELRAAAGLPAGQAAGRSVRLDRLPQRLEELRRHPAVGAVVAFLPELRPAWWVLRAWLAVLAVGWVFLGAGPLGLAGGLGLLGLPLLVAAVVVSVRAGQRARRQPPRHPRQRLVAAGVNGVLAVLALVALVAVQDRGTEVVYADPGRYGGYSPSGAGLTHPDGTPITNLFPYSADGRPLTGVLLYDQDGRALDQLSTSTWDGREVERRTPAGSPPAPANSYPQQQRVLSTDDTGAQVEELVPPLDAPPSAPSGAAVPPVPAAPPAVAPAVPPAVPPAVAPAVPSPAPGVPSGPPTGPAAPAVPPAVGP